MIGSAGEFTAPAKVCQEDLVNEYRAYISNITRLGAEGPSTFKLGSFGEAYVMANYLQHDHEG